MYYYQNKAYEMCFSDKVDLTSLYRRFHEAYKEAHSENSNQKNQRDANELWNELKKSENVVAEAEKKITSLLQKATKKKASVLHFFTSMKTSTPNIVKPVTNTYSTSADTNEDNQV